jgi:MFS family permease
MYTEKKAGEKIKNAAQGLFTFATYGVGMFIGTWYSGFVTDKYATNTHLLDAKTGKEIINHDWQTIWLYPAAIAAAVLVAFIFSFKEKKEITAA